MRTDTFDDIDRLFDRMQRVAGFEQSGGWHGDGSMRVDLSEHDDDLVVVADLPGFDRGEIDLSVDDDRLVIGASHDEMADDEGESYLRRERRSSAIRRTIALPTTVDAEAAHASYTNGVLTVTLPKKMADDGHRIDID